MVFTEYSSEGIISVLWYEAIESEILWVLSVYVINSILKSTFTTFKVTKLLKEALCKISQSQKFGIIMLSEYFYSTSPHIITVLESCHQSIRNVSPAAQDPCHWRVKNK